MGRFSDWVNYGVDQFGVYQFSEWVNFLGWVDFRSGPIMELNYAVVGQFSELVNSGVGQFRFGGILQEESQIFRYMG